MKNYKEIVKKLTQKSKMQIITKGCQKGYICQYGQRYQTFANGRITQYLPQIACIYIVVSQQKWKNTYLETT